MQGAQCLFSLVEQTQMALTYFARPKQVDFLFMDKCFTSQYSGPLQAQFHSNFKFKVLSPDFVPKFAKISQVYKCNKFGSSLVVPVSYQDRTLLLLQVVDAQCDLGTVQELVRVFLLCYANILEQAEEKDNKSKQQLILATFGFLMQHSDLNLIDLKLQAVFPTLFGFEACGILFVDHQTGDLLKFQYKAGKVSSQILFPYGVGCTGQTVLEDSPVIINTGERMGLFMTEIDNAVQVDKVATLLVMPIKDRDRRLWGVLQLVNSQTYITKDTIQSVTEIIESLGEILRAAEETRKMQNYHAGDD